MNCTASALEILGASPDFPITPKEHGTTFLFEHRHLWLRSRRQVAIARVRHEVEQAIRDFFYERDFVLVDTPILTGSIGEEAGEPLQHRLFRPREGLPRADRAALRRGRGRGAGQGVLLRPDLPRREVEDAPPPDRILDGGARGGLERLRRQHAPAGGVRQLHRGAGARPPAGGPEGAGARHRPARAGRRRRSRASPTPTRWRSCRGSGSDIEWGKDLGGDDETLLAQQYDRPVFVCNYPKAIKAFYMKENPDDPRTILGNDCLAPEGYGEIIGGSQREDDHDKLLARIVEQGLDPEAYRWYLDLRKYGTFVHSGFGLGARADRGVDLRQPAYPGDRSRSRGRSTGCTRRHYQPSVVTPRAFTSSHNASSFASPAECRSIPRSAASRSTARNRSLNFRLARSRALPGATPAFRARFTTANSRSPSSSISASEA